MASAYRAIDGYLARFLRAVPQGTTTILLSDHGAEATEGAKDPIGQIRSGGHTKAAKGVLFIHGPHAIPGGRIDEASVLDLAPTVLWLLGIPLSERLEGRILTEAFDPDFVRSRPVITVPTYRRRPEKPLVPSSADEAILKQLRALGYIESADEKPR